VGLSKEGDIEVELNYSQRVSAKELIEKELWAKD
jgi:hypothetical protein